MKTGEGFVVGEVFRGIGNGYDHCIYKIIMYKMYIHKYNVYKWIYFVCIYMDIHCIYNCQRVNKNVF